MRALMLFGVALALAYVAGWGLAGTEISGPAAVASFSALGLAVTPRAPKAAVQEAAAGKGKKKKK
jgi:hypothetical protein